MTTSGSGWSDGKETSHAAFLSNLIAERGRRPALFVAPAAEFMTEVRVPVFFTYRATRNDGRVYYSSVNMEVWAMVFPADESTLLSKFRQAATTERLSVPPGFPFVFYVFNFAADASRKE